MKRLQQFCVITTLTLTLALSAFAGEMGCPGVTAAGEMQFPGVSATADPVTEVALGFLLNAASLL